MSTYRTKSGIAHAAARLAVLFAAIVCSQPLLASAGAPETLTFGSGLSATIYTPDYLAQRLTTLDDAPAIRLDDGRYLPVTVDVGDPSIPNKGDGRFHSFTPELVTTALRAVHHRDLRFAVRIYLLPFPRRNLLASSTSGNEIFLSPHVLEIEPAVAAYIVAHELGHTVHNRFMPEGSAHWTAYRALRGITDPSRYSDTASHANRPREIFAEDFRVLFGGVLAAYDGRIENTELTTPALVPGLSDFFTRLAGPSAGAARVIAASYPNPFNPETEIRVSVPAEITVAAVPATVRVYSVTGALVRDLHRGHVTGDFAVRWDGKDDRGNRVASATYYAQVTVGGARETVKLVLLK